ncbi:MAG: hypothetical protein H0T73_13040 [Ardenticatenales bacterium]|nr:hypothetical protein [Ardenticatenales bacterium]
MRYTILLLIALILGSSSCAPSGQGTTTLPEPAATVVEPLATLSVSLPVAMSDATVGGEPGNPTGHPRLWLTPDIVTRLQGWATPGNPIYAEGLQPLVERAKSDMDAGVVIAQDCGQRAYNDYISEAYAELFAFMSLIDPNPTNRADYAARARTLLMHVMNAAAQGPASEAERTHRCPGDPDTPVYPPFRDPAFFTEDSDRLRWYGEAFPLTVDWIYSSLTAADKATINTVFTRWGNEIITRGYHHPEPIGVLRSPQLINDRLQVRWSGNNYYAAHMRNLCMMSMAMDPADSSAELEGYLQNATGAWLYIFDNMSRTEAQGGLLPEGFEYSPQTASYVIQFLLALRTAGQANPTLYGSEVVLDNNPFWDEFIASYLHSLSPDTEPSDVGPEYQPAWYGDAQRYHLSDFIDSFGALGAYDQIAGNTTRLNTLRWLQTHTAPGGEGNLVERVRGADYFRSAILYFMLLDPAAAPPTDPRPAMATDYVAPGMQRLFSRTDWGTDARWLTYALSWNEIDHQQADGNHIEFYRNGEWLTKARTGYANIAEGIASSEFRNTLTIQNARPDRDATDWRIDLWQRGSQWNYVSSGNPSELLNSFSTDYTYAAGDATNLYNSISENVTEVEHASRAFVWLKPDIIVVYDRAEAPVGRFKRVWWQFPTVPTISGQRTRMATATGQQLFITTLLPVGATMRVANPANDNVGETVATDEPMTQRISVEAPDGSSARFLHVMEGADAGRSAQATTLIRSSAGNSFEGALVNGTVVLFPVDAAQAFSSVTYLAPATTARHIITGLAPNTAYTATISPASGGITVTIQPGGTTQSDSAGLFLFSPEP